MDNMDHLYYMDYDFEEWEGFERATWCREINVRSFIQHNHKPYDGDESFLESPTQDTLDLWEQVIAYVRCVDSKRTAAGMQRSVRNTLVTRMAKGFPKSTQ